MEWQMQNLLILFLLFALAGCVPRSPVIPEQTHTIENIMQHSLQSTRPYMGKQWIQPQSVGIGFVWEEERSLDPSERSSTEDVHLRPGQVFNPYLILHTPETTTVLVTVLLDYIQTEFKLNDKQALLHEITIEPGGDLELPMQVNLHSQGSHDIIVIAFVDPYNKTLDAQYRSSMDSRMVGRRAFVTVGDSNSPAPDIEPGLRGEPMPEHVNLSLGAAFATASELGHPSDVERQLYVTTTKAGARFNYQIWLSNPDRQQTFEYALVQFFDYHQVPIQNKEFLFVQLGPMEEAILDSEIEVPGQPDVYQMQLVHVLDPYQSIAREEVEAPFVFGSPRIAIHAEP